MELINKVWGRERVIVNNESYCGKWLVINPGFKCSLHYHPKKRETFLCVQGVVEVRTSTPDGAISTLTRLDELETTTLTIEPTTPHQFWAVGDERAVLLEISTPHSDDDVVRLEPSGPLTNDL